MRNRPIRILTTLLAVMLCMAAFSMTALAAENTTSASPDGTGTVVSNTTNGDGKEFLTIKTSDGHVFYLIIDKQKTGDNVYFLDTVTTKDLLSLAQSDSPTTTGAAKNTQTSTASPTPKASSTVETSPTPSVSTPASAEASQAENQDNITKVTAVIVLLAVIIGVVILFFKLRKPKTPAKNEKDGGEYDFLTDEDAEDQSELQETPEAPDSEAEDDE